METHTAKLYHDPRYRSTMAFSPAIDDASRRGGPDPAQRG
jgi:hypothetical protein